MMRPCAAMVIVVAIVIVTPSPRSSAQAGSRPVSADTLHFVQKMRITQGVDAGAQGASTAATTTQTGFAVNNAGGDTLAMWIESASTRLDLGVRTIDQDLSSLLNKRFLVVRDTTGDMRPVRMPRLADGDPDRLSRMVPDTFNLLGRTIKDGGSSFIYSMHVPSDARSGSTWTQTVTRKPRQGAQEQLASTTITTYTVAGDSTIKGYHVLSIDASTTADANTTVSTVPMTITTTSRLTIKTRSYYSPDLHLVMASWSNGSGTDRRHVVNGPTTIENTANQTYESSLMFIR